MNFEQRIKAVAWTEAEVGVSLAGAIMAQQWLSDEKIFSKDFKENPHWFEDDRKDAKWYIRWSGGIKAGGALLASTYVANPWIKLLLFGIAFQGTIQQARILTWKDGKERFHKIGTKESDLDAKLKAAAEKYRTMGPDYVDGPDYLGAGEPLSSRYESQVAGTYDELGDRYRSNVAGLMDDGFSFKASDTVEAY